MVLTEETAQQKWCPMVNYQVWPESNTSPAQAYNNRGQDYEPATCRCLASDCMMWVWASEVTGHCGLARS